MPCCFLVILALLGPRIAIVLLGLFTGFFGKAYDGFLIPLLGFIFLPWTTIAYAWAINSRGEVAGFQAVVVIVAVLADLGTFGGGEAQRRGRLK